MKKVVILSAMTLLAGSLIFSSCSKKKDWMCSCVLTASGQTLPTSGPILDVKEDDAKKSCQSIEDLANSAMPGSTDCTLSEK